MTTATQPETTTKNLYIGDLNGSPISLELEIEHKGPEYTTTGKIITRQTIDLEEITEYDTLSICGSGAGHAGQMGDFIRENLDAITLNIPKDWLIRVLDLWDSCHLNGMQGGCRHQITEQWSNKPLDPSKPLGHGNYAIWARPDEHPNGLLCKPCPTCGYKYGSAWLVSILPEEIKTEALDLFSTPTRPCIHPLDAFADRHGISFECRNVKERPDKHEFTDPGARHFNVKIGKSRRAFSLYFSQGSAHTEPPTVKDVLNCLAMDASGYDNARSFEDWASEYGYDADSRKAERIYRTVKRQVEQLQRVLGEEAYKELLHTETL